MAKTIATAKVIGQKVLNSTIKILEVHARKKKISEDVDLKVVAKNTSGFAGADLENVLNEAALLAVRRNKNSISLDEIDEASDRVVMGPAKKSRVVTEKEKRTAAYHEAGHAVMGIKLDGANEVQKITIVPRGEAGGYNLMLPKEETYLQTKTQLLETISGLLGGRVAEELEFKEVTTGAHNDFEKAQVCQGGVKLTEVNENFELKKVDGLYVIGELLDVDGDCGGYNLGFAFLSAIYVGEDIHDKN